MPTDPSNVAADFLATRRAVATTLSAREIAEHVPAALREASVFSARTVYAGHLAETQREIVALLAGKGAPGAVPNPAEIRTRMKLRLAKLGYEPLPEDKGGLKDLSSDLRTNLIVSMQESRARGYAVWRSHQDEAVMSVWPAQELFRAMARKVPRKWRERWNDARSALGEGGTSATYALSQDGPFVALKNDPVWSAISRFGQPYPPFDYQSGMRLRNVDARRARELKVLKEGQPKPAPLRDPMRQLQSSGTAGMDEGVVGKWVDAFEGRAVWDREAQRVWVAPHASVVGELVDAAEAGLKGSAPFGFVPQGARTALAAALQGRGNVPTLPVHAPLVATAEQVAANLGGGVDRGDVLAMAEGAATARWSVVDKLDVRADYEGGSAVFRLGKLANGLPALVWQSILRRAAP
jgi:hypothetical protein